MADGKGEMTEIRIKDGTKYISNHCYSGNNEIISFYSSASVRDIGVGAFSDCTNLETVVLNEGLVRLKKEVFSGCTNLKEVYLPETLESIGEWAFRGCTSLKQLRIPKSVKEICAEAFLGCSELTIIVEE